MKYYYEDKEKQTELKRILDGWLGTPFRHQCGVKGMGTDCAHFVAKVLEEAGLLSWRKNLMPDYPKDWHLHNTRELLKEKVEKELKVDLIGKYENGVFQFNEGIEGFMNGDIVLLFYGKAASHIGIYFDGYLYQALESSGVCVASFHEKSLQKRIRYVYRLTV